ncbi:UNKNOWN [Stylonychia lemnae]|uniref:Uncharacterized protein n=1 Tax=Stylonychia lemnae TaxID=5949 RepID=A0A078AFQ8_STYLE|nr:UNKNOWN [Stylonychia lemnae]|eukprot:CDW81080.1 UNKNOWN [Stylonychia lemnae]
MGQSVECKLLCHWIIYLIFFIQCFFKSLGIGLIEKIAKVFKEQFLWQMRMKISICIVKKLGWKFSAVQKQSRFFQFKISRYPQFGKWRRMKLLKTFREQKQMK